MWGNPIYKSIERVCNVLRQHTLSSYMTQWPLWLSFSTSKPSPGPRGLHIHLLLSQCFPFVLHTHNQVSVSAPLVFVCACIGSFITQILMPFPSTACLGVLRATRRGKCNNQRALVPCQHGSSSREACPSRTAPATAQITPLAAKSLTHGEVRDYSSRLFPPSINAAVTLISSLSP